MSMSSALGEVSNFFRVLVYNAREKTASSFKFPPLFFSTGTFYFWLPALGERHASDFVKVGEKEERIGNLSPPPSSTPTNSAHLSLLVCEALLLLLLPFDVMAIGQLEEWIKRLFVLILVWHSLRYCRNLGAWSSCQQNWGGVTKNLMDDSQNCQK